MRPILLIARRELGSYLRTWSGYLIVAGCLMLNALFFHAFAMGMLLMTLTHLVLFVPISMRTKGLGIAIAFSSGIGGELSGWGVRFLHPAFAYLKIACFLLLEGAILWLIVVVAHALFANAPSAYTQGNSAPVRPLT